MALIRTNSVPVQWDGRTLEQRHHDLVSRLRHTFSHHTPTALDKPLIAHVHTPYWTDEVNRWIDETHDRWNSEMRRMRDDLLPLVPLEVFGEGLSNPLGHYGDVSSVLNIMDRQLRALPKCEEPSGNGLLDFLKDAYQLGEDGHVHFKLHFDLKGYGSDDIQVSTSKSGLTVHAKKITETEHASSSREYTRTVYVPPSVDKEHFECHLTEDGVLTVEAPVKTTDYKSLTFDHHRQLSLKPHSEAEVAEKQKSEKALVIQPTGVVGQTVLKDDTSGGEKLHVEIPVGPEYTANDLNVRLDSNRVVLSGKKEEVNETGKSKSTFIKAFTHSFDVPETVDMLSVAAQLREGKLLVEAPLLNPSTPK